MVRVVTGVREGATRLIRGQQGGGEVMGVGSDSQGWGGAKPIQDAEWRGW